MALAIVAAVLRATTGAWPSVAAMALAVAVAAAAGWACARRIGRAVEERRRYLD